MLKLENIENKIKLMKSGKGQIQNKDLLMSAGNIRKNCTCQSAIYKKEINIKSIMNFKRNMNKTSKISNSKTNRNCVRTLDTKPTVI